MFLTPGCSYGNGTGGTRPVHKVRYLSDIVLTVHSPRRVLMDLPF